MSDSRLAKERVFHDDRFGGDDGKRRNAAKYYSVMGNAAACYKTAVSKRCDGKRLLEIGCGTGRESLEWLEKGAVLTGIDISPEGIRKAETTIAEHEQEADFHVMDAENLEFPDGSFDVVVGAGILHHLDLEKMYSEIARVLDPGGLGVFIEPLGHNPIINMYRRATPSMRTEDEHPLMMRDIEHAKSNFRNVETHFYNLSTLCAVPLRNTPLFGVARGSLELFDQLLFSVSFMRRYAWQVVICLSDPGR